MDREQQIARQRTRELNFQPARQLLAVCRNDQIANHGYNLWVHTLAYTRNGGRLNQLGTTRPEVQSFLVQDLKSWIQELREGGNNNARYWWSLLILDAYFLGDEATDPIPHKKLGTTPEEINKFKRNLNIQF